MFGTNAANHREYRHRASCTTIFELSTGQACRAAPSGQAAMPPSGAPKARDLTAKARTERSPFCRVVFGHGWRDQVSE
jgi:hypothetical protein